MDAINHLQRQFVEYSRSLYTEGILDNQFAELQKLQDESNPDFVVEVVSLFFEDSEKLLNNLNTALQQQTVDYKQVDAHVHQFKGSSSSIGAQRVKDVCVYFRNCCEEKNLEGYQHEHERVCYYARLCTSVFGFIFFRKKSAVEPLLWKLINPKTEVHVRRTLIAETNKPKN